jgi:hypothetical protein
VTFECEECGDTIEDGEEYFTSDDRCVCFSCYYDDQDNINPFYSSLMY